MNKIKPIVLTLSCVWLIACGSDPASTTKDSIIESSALSNFDPAKSVIPFPNDLLFAGTTDATLNIPVAAIESATYNASDPKHAMNGLDGFSTTAPITTGFTGPILSSSLNANSIKLFEVTLSSNPNPGGAATAIKSQLSYGVDYIASVSSVDSSGSSLAILPLKPLKPSSAYYVVITNSLKSSDGKPMAMSGAYAYAKLTKPLVNAAGVSQVGGLTNAQAAALEPLRLLVSTSEATLANSTNPFPAKDIILSWLFSTQSIGDVLRKLQASIQAGAVPITTLVDSTPASTDPVSTDPKTIFAGEITVPYYLSVATGKNDPSPLGSYWKSKESGNSENSTHLTRYNLIPAATNSALKIPLMVSVPKSAMPDKGYPIVIFQHGITRNRSDMLGIADAFAAEGIAVVAIDMPMHGITDSTHPFYKSGGTTNERTFELDLITQIKGVTTAAQPDGTTDSSGSHYINLKNLLNSRDNIRQSVSDLFVLTKAVEGMTAGTNTFDKNKIYFLGSSLGAIVGGIFTALEPNVRDAIFVFGGGGIPKILDGSKSFSPSIVAGLAASGITKGTADYEAFLGAAQTAVDSADPLNYADALAKKDQGILYFEVVGGNSSQSDLVVPNKVPDANDSSNTVASPLAGTEPLLRLLGIATPVNSDKTGTNLKHSIKLVAGNHGSLLSADGANGEAVRSQIQKIAVNFIKNDGNKIVITDPTLLLSP